MLTWFTQSYWRDEAFSVLLAQRPILELLKISAGDFSPPLYYLMLKFWMSIFGVSEFATRSLSLLFFIAILVALIFFAIRILRLSPIRAIISILVLGFVNPLLLFYAAETRMYTMVAFLAILSWYFFLQKRTKWYIFVTVLGLFTHYFMLLILLTQTISLLIVVSRPSFARVPRGSLRDYGRAKQSTDRQVTPSTKSDLVPLPMGRKYMLPWGSFRPGRMKGCLSMPLLASFILFLPWLVFSLILHKGGADTSSFWIPRPSWSEFWVIPGILLTGFERGLPFKINLYPLTYVFWSIVVLSIIGNISHFFLPRRVISSSLSRACREKKSLRYIVVRSTPQLSKIYFLHVLFLGIWAFVPAIVVWAASQYTTPLFLPRYLIISAPAMILLIAVAVSRYRLVFQLLGIGIVVFFLWNYQAVQSLKRTKEDLRGKIYRIEVKSKSTDYLIVESALDYHVAQVYWFDKDKVKIVGKTYAEIPTYVGKSLIPPSAIVLKSQMYRYPGYVLSSNREVIPTHEY